MADSMRPERSSVCPSCGAAITPDSQADGLCAACLLDNVLDDVDDDTEAGSTDLASGSTFATLRIVRPLGKGGMASVYEAYDHRLDRTVALKVLPPEFLHDDTFARRFQQEARLVARLAHPHIVPVYASGIEQGIPWMTMPLLTGGNVGRSRHGDPRPMAETLDILRDVGAALDHAHAAGVIHRDIKTTNILLDETGAASLSDFGLARLLEGGRNITRAGSLAGTPQYMSPEQALGRDSDHRSDIYSLGVVAYELLSGELPFDDDAPLAVLLKQVNAPVPQPAQLSPRVFAVISRALAKDSADRWPSATEFVAQLRLAAECDDPPPSHWRLPRSLPPLALGSLATVAVALATFLAGGERPNAPSVPPAPLWMAPQAGLLTPAFVAAGLPAYPPPVNQQQGPQAAASSSHEAAGPAQPATRLPSDTDVPPSETSSRQGLATEASDVSITRTEGAVAIDPAPSPGGVQESIDRIVEPVRVRWESPVYPPVARAAAIEGDVLLMAQVGPDGVVAAVNVLQAPHPLLADAARKAVLRYRYTPGSRNGIASRFDVRITVRFRLQ